MAVSPSTDTVSGRVASVNPKGLKLEGQSDWLNFSKFAPDVVPPERGQDVTLTLDRAGFIRSVLAGEGSPGVTRGHQGSAGVTTGQRDVTITRLAVLKAAAEFGAARPDLKSGDVLAIAASWEAWVNRPLIDDVLDEAF